MHLRRQQVHISQEVHFDKRRRSINAPVDPSFEHHIYGQRDGPLPVASDMDAISDTAKHSAQIDFVWGLARSMKANSDQLGQEEQKTPGWAGFHSLVESDRVIRRSVVGYLPVIPSSPTEMGTVYQLLLRSLAIADRLRQRSVVIALDQAIYSKACEIVWKERALFSRVVLVMGGFHTAMVFLAVIGKRFGDGGLHDMLVESGTVGPSSVAAVLSGKHYNRAVRSHLIVKEALFRLLWAKFEAWLGEQGRISGEAFSPVLMAALTTFRAEQFTPESLSKLQQCEELSTLCGLFCEFCDKQASLLQSFGCHTLPWCSCCSPLSVLCE